MAFLQIDHLRKSYKSNAVIDDLSFSVERGEFLVVFGPSGSGKTVLLRLIAGMVRPDSGRIHLDGTDVTDDNPEHRDVAMAFQNFALYPHMTAFENIASPLHARRIAGSELTRRVEEAGRLLRIDHVLGHLPRALSNGQKQRTALARSLVSEPSVLLLDDPLRNVDAKVRYEMRLELPRLLRARDTTVVYVTQDYKEAMALGDRIAVLADGGFRQIDTPETIYNRPASARIARLFGDPPINLLSATRTGEHSLRVADNEIAVPANGGGSRQTCTLGIRPEDVAVSLEAFPGAFPVEIDAITPLNDRQVMLLRTQDGAEIFASQPQGAQLVSNGQNGGERAIGRGRMPAWAAFDINRAHFFESALGVRI
jgi:multiple sugar transport system ATP-binding protein